MVVHKPLDKDNKNYNFATGLERKYKTLQIFPLSNDYCTFVQFVNALRDSN